MLNKNMNTLKTEFVKNDMHYKILERSKHFYFAELSSTDSGVVVAYESGRIVSYKSGKIKKEDRTFEVDAGESIIGNSQFGKHDVDRAYTVNNKEKCYQYFKKYAKKDK